MIPEAPEDARAVLRDLGWLELPASAWLKAPRPETAAQMREFMLRKLEEQPPSGAITDLMILDASRDARYYGRPLGQTDGPDWKFRGATAPGIRCTAVGIRGTCERRTNQVPRFSAQGNTLARLRRCMAPANGD